LYRTVSSGSSFGGNSLQLEIGLGQTQSVVDIQVNWPNGINKWIKYSGLEIDNKYEIHENKSEVVKVGLMAMPFKHSFKEHIHHH
jgi:hypothetical protein